MYKRYRLFFLVNIILFFSLSIRAIIIDIKEQTEKGSLTTYYQQAISFQAQICQPVIADYKKQRLVVCQKDKILIYTSLYPEYRYGDYLEIKGAISEPRDFADFSYKKYLKRQGIEGIMYYPQIKLTSSEFSGLATIYLFREKIAKIISQNLPEPEAGLARALLLGEKHALSSADQEVFRRAGVSHLIVISGTHITILSALFFSCLLFLRFSRVFAWRFTLLFLLFYPLFIGLSPSAIRAAIMGIVIFIAFFYGRLTKITLSLLLAANLMLIFKPFLLFNISFQLSFAAVLGIIYIYPVINFLTSKWKKTINNTRFVLDIFNLSLSCQLAVFPLLALHFSSFSLFSLLSNLLLVWTLPFIISLLIIAIILASIISNFSILFFTPAYFLLKFMISIAKIFAAHQSAVVAINNFNIYKVFIYYLLLFLLLKFLSKSRR